MTVSRSIEASAQRGRWILLIAMLATLLLAGVGPQRADAHAVLEETTPANGAVLEDAPALVTLVFSEGVQPIAEEMKLFDSSGQIATLDAAAVDHTVELALPPDLADGSYIVGWRVISADSHPISGTISFSIGAESGTPVDVPEETDTNVVPFLGVVQGIAYATLVGAVGLVWFCVFVLGAVPTRRLWLATILAVVSAVAHLLLIPLTTIREVGESIGALPDSAMWDGSTRLALALAFVTVGLALEIIAARLLDAGETGRWVVGLAGLIALGSLLVVGHTVTVTPAWLMYGSDLVHGISASVWSGGLLGLILFLTTAFRGTPDERPGPAASARVVARFSWIAGWTVAALAISGTVMAWRILGSFDALLHTSFGNVLIIKVGAVLLILLVAAWNRQKLVPDVERAPRAAAGWNHLQATVLAESVLVLAVLGLTGFLVLQNPTESGTEPAAPAPATVPYDQTEPLGNGTLRIEVEPADTGANTISLTVLNAGDQPVELVNDPTVRISLPSAGLGPIEVTATPTDAAGHYTAPLDVPLAGDWTVEVVTRISKYEEPITTVTIPIPHTGGATPAA